MNIYNVTLKSELLGMERTVAVECNNPLSANEKARRQLMKATRVTDWKYVRHVLIHRA